MAKHCLNAAQVCAVLNHVRSAAMAKAVRAGGGIRGLDQAPHPLAGERHAAQGEKEAGTIATRGLVFARRADAVEMGAAFAEILIECVKRGVPERNDSLLIAFSANEDASCVEREIADAEGSDFRDAKSAAIEQLEDGAIAKSGCFGLRMRGCHGGAIEHLGDFRLGEGFGKDLPGFRGFDIDRGVVMDALIEQEPFVEAAKAAEFSSGRASVNTVLAEVFEQAGNVGFYSREEKLISPFEKLGEDAQITEISFASEWP